MTDKEKVINKYPKAQVEERHMGKPWKERRDYFVVVMAPWSMPIGYGRTEEEAWEDAKKNL